MVGGTPQMTIGGGGWGVLYPVKDRTEALLTSFRKLTAAHPKKRSRRLSAF